MTGTKAPQARSSRTRPPQATGPAPDPKLETYLGRCRESVTRILAENNRINGFQTTPGKEGYPHGGRKVWRAHQNHWEQKGRAINYALSMSATGGALPEFAAAILSTMKDPATDPLPWDEAKVIASITAPAATAAADPSKPVTADDVRRARQQVAESEAKIAELQATLARQEGRTTSARPPAAARDGHSTATAAEPGDAVSDARVRELLAASPLGNRILSNARSAATVKESSAPAGDGELSEERRRELLGMSSMGQRVLNRTTI